MGPGKKNRPSSVAYVSHLDHIQWKTLAFAVDWKVIMKLCRAEFILPIN